MSGRDEERPFIVVEDVEPQQTQAREENSPPEVPLIAIETLDTSELAQPEPDPPESVSPSPEELTHGARASWVVWAVLAGVVGVAVVGTVDWVVRLLARVPVLGAPAALAAAALIIGLFGLVCQEVRALRRLRDVEGIRAGWDGADGERLRRLILRVGADLGAAASARRAADAVDDGGPAAARRIMSREVLTHRDRRAAKAIGLAARQGFVMVTASPSPALDTLLLIMRAVRLLRQIAVLYGYRPGAFALRSLALAAGRDAAALVVADALAQSAAQSASHSLAKAGDAATMAGAAATATGIGAIFGIPVAVAGLALSLVGRTVGATGGAVGGGAAAAWRLYRFGLMVLVATRPLPFDPQELGELKAFIRSELLALHAKAGARAPR